MLSPTILDTSGLPIIPFSTISESGTLLNSVTQDFKIWANISRCESMRLLILSKSTLVYSRISSAIAVSALFIHLAEILSLIGLSINQNVAKIKQFMGLGAKPLRKSIFRL